LKKQLFNEIIVETTRSASQRSLMFDLEIGFSATRELDCAYTMMTIDAARMNNFDKINVHASRRPLFPMLKFTSNPGARLGPTSLQG
jgi:hypothetical protein